MATASVTYTFTSLTKALPAQVNQNFANVVSFLNDEVVHLDDCVGFSGWTAWTPEVSQPTTVAATVDAATYTQIGKLVVANFRLSITGTGTGGNAVVVSLPVTAARANDYCGSVQIYDLSLTTPYLGIAWLQTTTTMRFRGDWSGTGAWGFVPNVGLAAGDFIAGTVIYEAA